MCSVVVRVLGEGVWLRVLLKTLNDLVCLMSDHLRIPSRFIVRVTRKCCPTRILVCCCTGCEGVFLLACVFAGRRVHAGRRAGAFALPSAMRAVVYESGAHQKGEWGQGIACGPCRKVVVDFLNLGSTLLSVDLGQAVVDLVAGIDLSHIELASRDCSRAQVPDSRRDDG